LHQSRPHASSAIRSKPPVPARPARPPGRRNDSEIQWPTAPFGYLLRHGRRSSRAPATRDRATEPRTSPPARSDVSGFAEISNPGDLGPTLPGWEWKPSHPAFRVLGSRLQHEFVGVVADQRPDDPRRLAVAEDPKPTDGLGPQHRLVGELCEVSESGKGLSILRRTQSVRFGPSFLSQCTTRSATLAAPSSSMRSWGNPGMITAWVPWYAATCSVSFTRTA